MIRKLIQTKGRVFTAPLAVGLTLLLSPRIARAQQATGSNSPLEKVTLQLKWKHQFQFAGYYAAIDKGFYRNAGLDVRLKEAPESANPSDAVLNGSAEFGVADSDLVVLRARGKPVVALAAIYQHSPFVLVALKKSGIDQIHDLAGKRVAIEPNAVELLAYLQQEDLPPSRLQRVPPQFDVSALQRGEIAATSAYSTDEPFQLQRAGLDYVTFNPRAGGIDFYGDTLFTTEAQLRAHPKRVRAFVEASLHGWRYALAHPDEIITLIRSQYSRRHSRAQLEFEAKQSQRLILPDIVELGYMNPGRWQRILENYTELGLAPSGASLKGFLYERNPKPDWSWVYQSLGAGLLLLAGVTLLALRYYRLHAAVRNEMLEHVSTEKHLRSLETRYRVLAEYGPFPIVITGIADGKVRYINPSAARTFEISPEQAAGISASGFHESHEQRQAFLADLQEHGFVRNLELRLRSASGQVFWGAVSASLIVFEGEPAAFVAVMDISERKSLEEQLEKLATTDDLTELLNRRSFLTLGEEALVHAQVLGQPVSVLALDADQFKSINDAHGHEIGDIALRHLASMLRMVLRESDIAARVGGEEFSVLLPNTDSRQALALGERLCRLIEGQELDCNGHRLHLTISAGVASLQSDCRSLEQLLRAADQALYRAKRSGRNRVEGALTTSPEVVTAR